MSATNDPIVNRYNLPGVPTPILPADVANKAYVDAAVGLSERFSQAIAAINFNLDITDADFDLLNYVMCTFSLEITGAANIQIQLNGDVSGSYAHNRIQNDAGTISGAYTTASAVSAIIADSAISDKAMICSGWIKFYRFTDAAGNNFIGWSGFIDCHTEGTSVFGGRLAVTFDSLTAINFLLSGNLIDTESSAVVTHLI